MTAKLKYKLIGKLNCKILADGAVYIKGFANKNIIDSVGERMIPQGCKFDRFASNPTMLFNHDKNYVIGKYLKWEPKEEGLWVEGVLSNSDTEKVAYVRDLVAEGMLSTLSIGFTENGAKELHDGTREIHDWTLHEVSVVSIPCNQESTFTSSIGKQLNKELLGKSLDEVKTMLKKQLEENEDEKLCKPKKPKEEMTDEEKPEGDEEKKTEEVVEEPKEDEEKTTEADTLKNAFEDCVASKIPKLIDEGKSQEQAVAMAIAMCEAEGKCYFNSIAETEKQMILVEQPMGAQPPTAAIEATDTNSMGQGNPLYDEMLKQSALMQAVLDQLIKMNASIALLANEETMPENEVENEPVGQSEIIESQLPEAPKALINDIKLWQDSIDNKLKKFGF